MFKKVCKEFIVVEINKKLGQNIKKYRLKKGWTQEQLGFEAGLHRAYIGQIERGEKDIDMRNLKKITDAFEIKLSDFFSGF